MKLGQFSTPSCIYAQNPDTNVRITLAKCFEG
jgi:hypothetical protein